MSRENCSFCKGAGYVTEPCSKCGRRLPCLYCEAEAETKVELNFVMHEGLGEKEKDIVNSIIAKVGNKKEQVCKHCNGSGIRDGVEMCNECGMFLPCVKCGGAGYFLIEDTESK